MEPDWCRVLLHPLKHQALLEKKNRLAKELMVALKQGLDKLVERGMIPADALETHVAVEAEKPNEGGGDSLKINENH